MTWPSPRGERSADPDPARVDWFGLAAYPLSGGFKPWSLLTARMARHLLRFERAIEPLVGRLAAFRVMVIIEKKAAP